MPGVVLLVPSRAESNFPLSAGLASPDKEQQFRDVIVEVSLGCGYRAVLQFKIVKEVRKASAEQRSWTSACL